MKRLSLLVPAVLISAAASSQTPAPPVGVDPSVILAPRPAEGSGASAADTPTISERALDAIRLPVLADRLRVAGVPVGEVRLAIDALRESGADADEAADVLEAEGDAARVGEPSSNFGTFVRARLDEGLRGRALSDAIRAEHAATGRGHGHGGPERGERADGSGAERRPESAGRPADPGAHGRPEGVGRAPEGQGRPHGGRGQDDGPASRPSAPGNRGGGR